MYFDRHTSTYTLIGTVNGGGYDCRTDEVTEIEGEDNGMWNKVSAHVDWIKERMEEMNEKDCPNKI